MSSVIYPANSISLPQPSRKKWLRWVAVLLLIVLLAIIAVVLWAYWIAHSALPQLDGSVRATGLQGKVVVVRDSHGVPTLNATSLPDLFFAQGYVTAQDRLWQMDIMRRFAAGDLAEVVGTDGLAHDKEQRILGMRIAAQHAVQALSPIDRSYFEAYARGVNASIENSRGHWPIEFRILGYSPRAWTMEDSFTVGAQLVQELNHGPYHSALLREKFLAALSPELTGDLFVNASRHDHPPALEASKEAAHATRPSGDSDDDPEGADMEQSPVASFGADADTSGYDLRPGSNDWVVSGAHTVSGKPLLSNDMHLGHQMPNLWYEAHLHSGDFDVVGVTLPGVPFVVVGHNQRVAWGFTNVGPTVEDVYIENFNAAGQYETPQGWREPERRSEIIHVKGQPDVTIDVTVTRHGPVISDLVPGETRKLALRWTLYDSFNDPFYEVNAAQNWQEFRQALSTWGAPGQNVVYADVDGHIGYQATGRIPIRASGDGSLPVSGRDDGHEWTGFIPFEQMPSVFDPPSGMLATANGRIAPDGYKHSISTEWDAPWRTERIYRVLNSGKKLAPPDMLALETDVESALDHACAERFVEALDHAAKVTSRARQARDLLRDWDGRLSADSSAATIEIHARRELTRLLLEPKLEQTHNKSAASALTWQSYHWMMSSVWLENVLSEQPKRWLPERFATYDELLAAAVEAALNEPDAPKDLAKWRWGSVSPIDIEHPVLGKLPLIGKWTGPGLHEQSGGSFTVKQVGRAFGPSERFTADLSNFDHSTLNIVTGQAGNFLSPYYMDQWDAWHNAYTFRLPYSKEAVHRTKAHELVLEP